MSSFECIKLVTWQYVNFREKMDAECLLIYLVGSRLSKTT